MYGGKWHDEQTLHSPCLDLDPAVRQNAEDMVKNSLSMVIHLVNKTRFSLTQDEPLAFESRVNIDIFVGHAHLPIIDQIVEECPTEKRKEAMILLRSSTDAFKVAYNPSMDRKRDDLGTISRQVTEDIEAVVCPSRLR